MLKPHATVMCFAVLLLTTTADARAQGTGEITGTVSDSSGGVVPGVSVTVTNDATGAERHAITNEAGVYSAPALPPGSYTLVVELPGFQTQTRRNLVLQVQQVARADFKLGLGAVSESLEVTAGTTLLATEDSTVGQVIDNKRIVELPLNGRNYLQLAALTPGVNINSSPSAGATSFQGGQRARQQITINGQRGQFNHFTLDGVENTDPNFNTYILLPSLDALQEFKVQSATYPAEYGFGITQINVTTKSGTNRLRGSLFEYLRNERLDAKNFFDSKTAPIPPFTRNQYGGTAGGPIMRNRLFFFGNYEGLREDKALTASSTVPSLALRSGDFTGRRPIYDPATRTLQPDGTITAQQFPGNRIPASRIDPKTTLAMQFWPEANLAGTGRNFLSNESRGVDGDQWLARVDLVQSDQVSWYGRASWAKDREYSPSAFPGQGTWTNSRPDQVLLANTWVLGRNLVSSSRFGWSRFDNLVVGVNSYVKDVNGELMQIQGLNLGNDPAFWGLPTFGVTGYTGFGDRTNIYLTHNNIFEIGDDLSWVRGKHLMKMGFSVKRIHYNQLGNQFALGGFDFDGTATENPAARPGTGDPMADFLLGITSQSYTAVQPADAQLRSTYSAGYFADSWRILPALTIDLGLRYEYLTPFRDLNDQSVNLAGIETGDPILVRASNQGNGRDPYEGQTVRFTRAPLVRDGRMGPGLVNPDRNNWAPRVGIAYSASQKMVVRAGFGVFYNMIDLGNSIFDMARTLAGLRRDFPNRDFPDLQLSSRPFHTGASAGIVPLAQPLILANAPEMRSSYVNQWSANVQRALTSDLSVDIGYVGSRSYNLKKVTGYNNPLPGPGSIDARRPYQQFGWIQYPNSIGSGRYHAFQVKAEQRLRKGFTALSSYTLGKSMDDTSGVRPGGGDTLFVNNPWCNTVCEWGRSSFDVRHRWVTSALVELPVGRGRRFGSGLPAIADAFIGGWQIGGILTLESGLPTTPNAGRDTTNIGTGAGNRPALTGVDPNLPSGERTVDRFFRTEAFAQPPLYTFGEAGRNIVEGPGIINLDASLTKRFSMGGTRDVEFRAEVFNAANHPIFGFPDTNLLSATYGRLTSTRIDSRQIQLALRFRF
jgi:carboxypeptidase family protein